MPPSALPPKVAGTFVSVNNDLIEITVINDLQYINLRKYVLKFLDNYTFYTGGASALEHMLNNNVESNKIGNLDLTSEYSKYAKIFKNTSIGDKLWDFSKIPYFKDHTTIDSETMILGWRALNNYNQNKIPFLVNCREGRSRSVGIALLFTINKYVEKNGSSDMIGVLNTLLASFKTKDVPSTKNGTVPEHLIETPATEILSSIMTSAGEFTNGKYK